MDPVSIADAKPIPWRHHCMSMRLDSFLCFNRRREANPLATRYSPTEWSFPLAVSIADAKPIPWRHEYDFTPMLEYLGFNRRREANPLATVSSVFSWSLAGLFQSQTRSQS